MAATRELSASFIWQPIVQIWKCLPFSGSGAGEITGINSIVAPFGTVGLPRCGLETGSAGAAGTKINRDTRQQISLQHPPGWRRYARIDRTVYSSHPVITWHSPVRSCPYALNVPDRQRPNSLLKW